MEVAMNGHAGLIMAASPTDKKARAMTQLEMFDEVFPVLVDNLVKQGLKDDEISGAMQWFKKVLEYNVPHGKKNRGMAVVQSYMNLKEDPAEEDIYIARVLGWCIEMLQAFFLVADDIMDQSVTRRGKPCWFRNSDVGLEAINDSYLLESAIYVILKRYCRAKPYYVDLLELFHETTLQTVIGQCLDMMATCANKVDFSTYTMARYKAIVKWKTAYYSFYLPVACAMYMAGVDGEDLHTKARTILLQMGEYFQIQDDYLDCYGDPAITGKVGTDIQDNKVSWLVIQALQKASPEQHKILEENYAQHDPAKVDTVKNLYNTLEIEKAYREYEEWSFVELQKLISKLGNDLPQEMFTAFAQKIYKRNK